MSRLWLVLVCVLALVVVACGGPAASPGGPGSPPAQTPAGPGEESPAGPGEESPATGESPAAESPATGESPAAEECVIDEPASPNTEVSGDITLAGWSAANATEENLLNCVLDKFEAQYPNVNVTFEVVAGEYPAVMATRLGSGDAPDLFYVNQAYSQDWIDQGLLAPLDQMASDAGFDLSAFYPGYLSPFQRDGQTYGFPKDSSILAMQTNDAMLSAAGVEIPTTTDELVAAAQAIKDAGVVDIPMCFAAEWQRAGAFVHGFGGGMVDEGGAPTIDSEESRAGIQWYLDQYGAGLAATPGDLAAPGNWCGGALGGELVAFAFEGNWIGPALAAEFPNVAYTISAIPAGPVEQATLSFTVGYGMHPNAPNPDASWALLSYLTGQEGMQEWVNGGLVLPARSDVEATGELLPQYAAFADIARPGEGVTPQWGAVSQAFNGALAGEATGGRSAQAVIDATLPALQSATGQ